MGKTAKEFWDLRSKKLSKKRKRKFSKNYRVNKTIPTRMQQEYVPDYIIKVPECFSFIENLEETALLFCTIMNKFKSAIPRSDFLIEARNVSKVTTDAIMYLIALMRNHKESRRRLYSFHGTYPDNDKARMVFIESGLLKFVKSKSKNLPQNSSKMSIVCGRNSDGVLAKQICLFVADKLNVSNVYVKDLYEVIIEMMSNVYYHAYNEEDTMIPEWYMYAECNGNDVKFLFLDTGIGIGKTVKKHSLYEKVVNKIGIGSESKLIKSALDGDFRTQTGKTNHGKGLPSIKEYACSDKVADFHVMSGKGHCWFDNEGHIYTEELKYNISGTIYSFIIKMEEE